MNTCIRNFYFTYMWKESKILDEDNAMKKIN